MNLIIRFFNWLFKISEFIFYYARSFLTSTPPIPETVLYLIAENHSLFFDNNPDINAINSILHEGINNHKLAIEQKLKEKVSHISNISGLSIHNLRSVLYDSEKILDVKVLNWLQLKNNLFILEISCEIPVVFKKFRTFKTKKYYNFLDIGLLDCTAA